MLQVVKNLPANAEDTRDGGSIPEVGSSPGDGNGNPLQYFFAWKILWIEESGSLQYMGLQSWTQLSTHLHAKGKLNYYFCFLQKMIISVRNISLSHVI